MTVVRLEDPADPRIDDFRNVPDPELLARRGVFVAEGRLVVQRLLANRDWTPRAVLVTDTALAALTASLEAHQSLPVFVADQPLMNSITGFNIHRGCLALAERRPLPHWRAVASAARRLVVLERVGNADNVGAIFRHAAAFGVDGILLGPSCVDPLYRKAIRTSMGAALSVPFADAEPWPATLVGLRRDGWSVVALTPAAPSILRDIANTPHDRIALVVGHEGAGLTPEALEACQHQARIQVAAGVDSLNAATAAAIALYEFNQAGHDASTNAP